MSPETVAFFCVFGFLVGFLARVCWWWWGWGHAAIDVRAPQTTPPQQHPPPPQKQNKKTTPQKPTTDLAGDLVDRPRGVRPLRRLERARRRKAVLGLERGRREVGVEAALQRRHGVHGELDRVDALVRQAAVEELAVRGERPGGDAAGADAGLAVGGVDPVQRPALALGEHAVVFFGCYLLLVFVRGVVWCEPGAAPHNALRTNNKTTQTTNTNKKNTI